MNPSPSNSNSSNNNPEMDEHAPAEEANLGFARRAVNLVRALKWAAVDVQRVPPPADAAALTGGHVDAYRVAVPSSWLPAPEPGRQIIHANRAFFSNAALQLEGALLRRPAGLELPGEGALAARLFAPNEQVAAWGRGMAPAVVKSRLKSESEVRWCTFPPLRPRGGGKPVVMSEYLWLRVGPETSPGAAPASGAGKRRPGEPHTNLDFACVLDQPTERLPPVFGLTLWVHRAYCRVLLGATAVRLEDMAEAAR